ncbi:hypothetical protein V1291_002698 [Nitrobacteraceae bacterium AZCC 1564]
MKHTVRMRRRCNQRIQVQDAESLLTVLTFSLAGLLGCLISQAPLDGPAFTLARWLSILASALLTPLTGLAFGGGE